MTTKNEYSFPLIIIAVVLGGTIFKEFDFKNLTFEKPSLAVVYILTLLMTIILSLKKIKQKQRKRNNLTGISIDYKLSMAVFAVRKSNRNLVASKSPNFFCLSTKIWVE